MTFHRLLPLLTLLLFVFYSCQVDHSNKDSDQKSIDKRVDDKLYPYEGFFLSKNFPEEKFAYNAYREALKDVSQLKKTGSLTRAGEWIQQGPGNIGGRVNTIAINPENPTEMMLGYSIGGIFRTRDNGTSWQPVFDDESILSLSDILYDPNDASVIYAGTGDHNISGYPVTGDGIYKSDDGGDTWNVIGLREAGVISEIGISPANSDIVYAASMGLPFERTQDRGLYKSDNGGQDWEKVFYLNDSTGVIDIEVHPSNPDIVYAATWTRIRNNGESTLEGETVGIYKTIDGGATWEKLTNGLPEGRLIRPGLAMFPSDPDILYAMFVYDNDDFEVCNVGFQLQGIYKTTNGGESWEPVNTTEDSGLPCNVLAGFGWYFGKIRVNPDDVDNIFILGVDLYATPDGGVTWERAAPPWWSYEVHADKHDLVFSNGQIFLGTDGGAYTSVLGADFWVDIENIVSTQFYRVALNPHQPFTYYGGAQDNGTTGGNSAIINDWPRIFGGDGFQVEFDPTDPQKFYVLTQNGGLRVTYDGGEQFENARDGLFGRSNWDMPYILSSGDPSTLYAGTDRMFRTVTTIDSVLWEPISDMLVDTLNATISTSPTISTIDESPVNNNIIYCGTSDGLVWRSLDKGDTWELINEGLPRRYISDVKASKSDPAIVYVTIQGYRDNDFTPYIYRSQDNGDSWEAINGDLPQIAINDILLPNTDDDSDIFVGTDAGVFFTRDAGISWELLGDNLPVVPVYDMRLDYITNDLVVGTFARGIYTFALSQIEDVAINDLQKNELLIRNNVSATEVYIDNLPSEIVSIIVSNLGGNSYNLPISYTETYTLDVTPFSNGLHFFTVITQDGQKYTGKFIKI